MDLIIKIRKSYNSLCKIAFFVYNLSIIGNNLWHFILCNMCTSKTLCRDFNTPNFCVLWNHDLLIAPQSFCFMLFVFFFLTWKFLFEDRNSRKEISDLIDFFLMKILNSSYCILEKADSCWLIWYSKNDEELKIINFINFILINALYWFWSKMSGRISELNENMKIWRNHIRWFNLSYKYHMIFF